MAIKASGHCLHNVTKKNGFVLLELPNGNLLDDSRLKPSLEFPLHLLLGDYVIHTHPIIVGALVCSVEGKKYFRHIFPDKYYLWVDYSNPGKSLSDHIRKRLLRTHSNLNQGLVIFLQNHGLFVSSANKKRCIRMHRSVINELEVFFRAITLKPRAPIRPNGYLTPDHVIFENFNRRYLSKSQRAACHEIKIFADTVFHVIKEKGWTVNYLNPYDVKSLLQMEGEKYRRSLWGLT